MRNRLDNLKTLLNNSINRNGINHPNTLKIAEIVDREIVKEQKEMM